MVAGAVHKPRQGWLELVNAFDRSLAVRVLIIVHRRTKYLPRLLRGRWKRLDRVSAGDPRLDVRGYVNRH